MLYVHSVETLGTKDGPGVRTVFFLQGCGLRCKYCHNPDTWTINTGKTLTAQEIADIARRYREYYGDNGGVTFSGGEPLIQSEYLLKCVLKLKDEGINVYIDTAGIASDWAFKVLAAADGILLDIKHSDKEKYHNLTGGNLVDTLKTLEYIRDNNMRCTIRQVIVPGINDDAAQVTKLVGLIGDLELELLPYHTYGVHKWEQLGLRYGLEALPPTKQSMDALREVVRTVRKDK